MRLLLEPRLLSVRCSSRSLSGARRANVHDPVGVRGVGVDGAVGAIDHEVGYLKRCLADEDIVAEDEDVFVNFPAEDLKSKAQRASGHNTTAVGKADGPSGHDEQAEVGCDACGDDGTNSAGIDDCLDFHFALSDVISRGGSGRVDDVDDVGVRRLSLNRPRAALHGSLP